MRSILSSRCSCEAPRRPWHRDSALVLCEGRSGWLIRSSLPNSRPTFTPVHSHKRSLLRHSRPHGSTCTSTNSVRVIGQSVTRWQPLSALPLAIQLGSTFRPVACSCGSGSTTSPIRPTGLPGAWSVACASFPAHRLRSNETCPAMHA